MVKRVPAIIDTDGKAKALVPPDLLEYVAGDDSRKFLCTNDVLSATWLINNAHNHQKTSPIPVTNELLVGLLDGYFSGSGAPNITMIGPAAVNSYGAALTPQSLLDNFANRELTNNNGTEHRGYSTAFAYYPRNNANGMPIIIRYSGGTETLDVGKTNIMTFPGYSGSALEYTRAAPFSDSSAGFVDVPGLTDTITVAANSKVMILVSFHHWQTSTNANQFKIVDNTGSPVDLVTTSNVGESAAGLTHNAVIHGYLTSALSAGTYSYKVQAKPNGATLSLNQNPHIFLVEIPSTSIAERNATFTAPTTSESTLSQIAVSATGYKRFFLWSGWNQSQSTSSNAHFSVRYAAYNGSTNIEISPVKNISGIKLTSSPPSDHSFAWVTPRIDMTSITHLRLLGACTNTSEAVINSTYGFIAIELPDR